MNRPDFDKLMQEQAEKNAGKRLLLHCCCAPCSSACLERLKDYFKITVLFYNPNIEDGEYERRKSCGGLLRKQAGRTLSTATTTKANSTLPCKGLKTRASALPVALNALS